MPKSDEGGAGRHTAWLAWAFVLLFVIYPLSIGPAYRLAGNVTPSSPLNIVYSPLLQIARHSKAARNILDWYVTTVWKG
jgi:hypothetical protein